MPPIIAVSPTLTAKAMTLAVVTSTPTPRARSSSSRTVCSIRPSLDPRTYQQASTDTAKTASMAQ